MSYRKEMMDKATKIVEGDRDEKYGKPENNFRQIAALWNAYLDGKSNISIDDVANMMILLKLARAKQNPDHLDNFVDIAGYAACNYDIIKEVNLKYSAVWERREV